MQQVAAAAAVALDGWVGLVVLAATLEAAVAPAGWED
jgi:hypothetical protein